MLAQKRDIISFAPGYPAPETFPWAEFQDIARELLSGDGRRGAAVRHRRAATGRCSRPSPAIMAGARRHATALERLLVTTGSQQGLDLVARVLLDPGDVVLVELPTYTGAITAFRNVQAQMVGVPQESDGIDRSTRSTTSMRAAVRSRPPRALLSTSCRTSRTRPAC